MNAITKTTDRAELATLMHQAGQAANVAAAGYTFEDHTSRKAGNTIRRKRADLALFEAYLMECGIPARGLYDDPAAWRGITWGLVEGYKVWQLRKGYAVASINGHLSTVRTFARLAEKAGAIDSTEGRLIGSVEGYANSERRNIDAKRKADGLETRIGAKKADPVTIPADVAEALATRHPFTPQGRRDALLMCLLLEHGLRVGEVAILTAAAFDLREHTITFYRPKVGRTQTHEMTPHTRAAAAAYLKHDAPAEGIIWRKSHKGTGALSGQLSEKSATRALTKRVGLLGRHAGVIGLSAHDGRHFWATYEARHGTPIDRLKDAGGWSSQAMPLRYIGDAAIANMGTARLAT